jgi:hypothetical protein
MYALTGVFCVQDAAEHWHREGLDFAIHMGDIIDGQNAQTAASSTALEEVRGLRTS